MEHEPQPQEELDTYFIGNLSLRFWHMYLSSAQDEEQLSTRYGRTGEEIAWWSLGLACIINARREHPGDGTELMDFAMIAAVSNDKDVLQIVLGNWVFIPDVVKDKINESGRKAGFWS